MKINGYLLGVSIFFLSIGLIVLGHYFFEPASTVRFIDILSGLIPSISGMVLMGLALKNE